MRFKFNYRSLLWTLLADGLLVFSLKVFSWLYWWWFHYLSLYCLFPTLGLGLQAEGLGLHCHLEASLVACEEPIYYLRCIWSWQYLGFLQSLSFKFLSKKREVLFRWYTDANTPLWGTWICSQGPAKHRKKILSCYQSQPEARHSNGSEPAGYQTSYKARCIDRTNRTKQRREALSQSVPCRTRVNTHLSVFVFSLTIRATSSITSTITSRARSSITLTLFTRSLSVDGRAAASMQTDLIQFLLPIPLAEATSQINDGGDESTVLTTNNQPAIKNLFTTNLD